MQIHIPIVSKIIREFVFEFVAPDGSAAGTITQRVASLNHELGDHAVEDDTLKVATA